MEENVEIAGNSVKITKDYTKKGKKGYSSGTVDDAEIFEIIFGVLGWLYRRFFGKIVNIQIDLKEKTIAYRKIGKKMKSQEVVISHSDITQTILMKFLKRRFLKKWEVGEYSLSVETSHSHQDLARFCLVSECPAERYKEIIWPILKAFAAIPMKVEVYKRS